MAAERKKPAKGLEKAGYSLGGKLTSDTASRPKEAGLIPEKLSEAQTHRKKSLDEIYGPQSIAGKSRDGGHFCD